MSKRKARLLGYVRYGLPAALVIAGAGMLIWGNGGWQVALGVVFVGLAVLVTTAGFMVRRPPSGRSTSS